MSVSRSKTWIAEEVLNASDLNAEFNNILTNGEDLGWPATKAKDLDGQELILDANADTSITASTDNRIDFRLAGGDFFRMDGTVATPVNGLDFIASAAGSAVQILARGGTNIPLTLTPKGTGVLQLDGTVTKPTHPCFLATNSANDDNATGDGTVVTVDFDTETFDLGDDFLNDTFTAPVTGRYLLATAVRVDGITAVADSLILTIRTSNRLYRNLYILANSIPAQLTLALSVVADMTAADTATVEVVGAGDTKVQDIFGGAGSDTYFSGCLLA